MRTSLFSSVLSSLAVILLAVGLSACGDDDGGGTIDGGGGGTPTCAAYCQGAMSVMTACTGANIQYNSEADCMAVCAAFPVGTTADTSGNTLGCRVYHAGNAVADPVTHCGHAGPGGNGACGDNCAGLCAIADFACDGEGNEANPFPGDDCLTVCAAYPTDPAYASTVTDGDSFACRLYHATQAVTVPDPHCTHIDQISPPCGVSE